MWRKQKASIVVVAVLSVTGCGAPLDKRWSAETGGYQPSFVPIANVVVSTSPSTQPAKITLKDIPDHAAAVYISAVEGYNKKSQSDFLKALSSTIIAAKSSADQATFGRVLVLTISKSGFAPADRIVQAEIKVKPTDFYGFSDLEAAETAYTNIAIDGITVTNTLSGTGSISPTFAGSLAGAGGLSLIGSQATADTENVIHRVEQLTVNIDGNTLRIFREGERNFDLTGNTLVKLSLVGLPPANQDVPVKGEVTPLLVTKLDVGGPSEKGGWKRPRSASISVQQARGLQPKPLHADVTMDYVLRHVTKGADTIREDDDTVHFFSGHCEKKAVILMSASDVGLFTWGVTNGRDFVAIETSSFPKVLAFTKPEDAEILATWLTALEAEHVKRTSIGSARLGFIGTPNDPNTFRELSGKFRIGSTSPRVDTGAEGSEAPLAALSENATDVNPDCPALSVSNETKMTSSTARTLGNP